MIKKRDVNRACECVSIKKYKSDMSDDAVFSVLFNVFRVYGVGNSDLDLRDVDGHDQFAGPKFSYRHAHWRVGN